MKYEDCMKLFHKERKLLYLIKSIVENLKKKETETERQVYVVYYYYKFYMTRPTCSFF